ncbi:TetR family transcriptional regulator [Oceanobacillus neutriphilus]|uniref:Uncharacterized protein n=1 Tax=Oceanobacillus neutriphilus TaxID=531815 RepID=A0ABQ2NQJ9_9BACI|nr:TetR family transcriptional regulator [Oceanobacillus neutriphilus]GGP07326.1 hypothetical protein GCM10011346_02870 [Oceanobacillus neutriphilus]
MVRTETLYELRQRVSDREAKTATKAKKLLAKGKKLTFSEIQWLLNKEVPRSDIKKALKMNGKDFADYLVQHGIPRIRTDKEDIAAMKKPSGDIELAKKLLRETDLSVQEIVKRAGVTAGSVYYHKKKKTEKKASRPSASEKGSDSMPIKEHFNKQIEELESELNQYRYDVKALEETNAALNRSLDQERSKVTEREKMLEQMNKDLHRLFREREELLQKNNQENLQKQHDLLLEYINLGG